VVAAAVILNPRRDPRSRGLEALSAEERERLAPIIRERSLAWAVACRSRRIDNLNIWARRSWRCAGLLRLPVCPTHIQSMEISCPYR